MPFPRSISVALSALLASGVVIGAQLFRPAGPSEHPTERPLTDSVAVPVAITYPGANVVLEPAPAGSCPSVSPAAALATYLSSGLFHGAASQSPDPVDIALHEFSDNTQGDLQPDGTVLLKYQHVLAYSVIFHAVPYSGVGEGAVGGRPDSVPEDLVVIVDATSGTLLEGFADLTPACPHVA